MSEINLGSGNNLAMNTSTIVTCHEALTLIVNGKGGITLDVKIQADFNTVPEEYHEVFMNMLTSKYCKTASFGDNPFSRCIPAKKRKWWQLWK
jgi:hypothetical protein